MGIKYQKVARIKISKPNHEKAVHHQKGSINLIVTFASLSGGVEGLSLLDCHLLAYFDVFGEGLWDEGPAADGARTQGEGSCWFWGYWGDGVCGHGRRGRRAGPARRRRPQQRPERFIAGRRHLPRRLGRRRSRRL